MESEDWNWCEVISRTERSSPKNYSAHFSTIVLFHKNKQFHLCFPFCGVCQNGLYFRTRNPTEYFTILKSCELTARTYLKFVEERFLWRSNCKIFGRKEHSSGIIDYLGKHRQMERTFILDCNPDRTFHNFIASINISSIHKFVDRQPSRL